jgi:hypothetical protein
MIDLAAHQYFLRIQTYMIKIHDAVEFGSADSKRRKKLVKVRIIENMHKNLEERYNIYMALTTLNNYLLHK